MAENFPNMGKETIIQIQKVHVFPPQNESQDRNSETQYILFIWLQQSACRILFHGTGIEPTLSEVEAWNLNLWTSREVTSNFVLSKLHTRESEKHQEKTWYRQWNSYKMIAETVQVRGYWNDISNVQREKLPTKDTIPSEVVPHS